MDLIVLLGIVTGSRTMMGIAVVCWGVWLGLLPEHGWGVWAKYLVSALVFTGFAIAEVIGDTRPNAGSRKAAFPALSRAAFGALVGAVVATSLYEPIAGGILGGVLGAVIGTWGGYAVRVSLAKLLGRDLPVALTESAVACLLAIFAVYKLHQGVLLDLQRGTI